MRRNIPKKWGEYQTKNCAFCGRMATQKNETGVEVCYQHTKSVIEEIKCTCGSWLEQRVGKFGAYFNCLKCGNVSFAKAMEMKALQPKISSAVSSSSSNSSRVDVISEIRRDEKKPKKVDYSERKEIIITSRDVEYF